MLTQQKAHEIFSIQKQCVRLITGQKKITDSTILFKNLRILKFKDIIHTAMCKLGHNISHKHYPSPILKLFNKFGGEKTHRYPTRNKHVPNVHWHHSEQYNKSFLCRSVTVYNNLPQRLKDIVNATIFVRELKQHLPL